MCYAHAWGFPVGRTQAVRSFLLCRAVCGSAQGGVTTTSAACVMCQSVSSCSPFVVARSEKTGLFLCLSPTGSVTLWAALCAFFWPVVISVSCSCRMVTPWAVLEHNPQILWNVCIVRRYAPLWTPFVLFRIGCIAALWCLAIVQVLLAFGLHPLLALWSFRKIA